MLFIGFIQFFPMPAAADRVEFDYDIFKINDTLAFWLDFNPALDQAKREDILAGLDIYVTVETAVERPKGLFYSDKVAESEAAFLISHPLTEDRYKLRQSNYGISDRVFESLLALTDFLTDSLIFMVVPLEALGGIDKIRLKFTIKCKSFSSKILPEKPDGRKADLLPADTSDSELLTEIFSFFFNLIGYGEDKYKVSTPYFRPDELPAFQR